MLFFSILPFIPQLSVKNLLNRWSIRYAKEDLLFLLGISMKSQMKNFKEMQSSLCQNNFLIGRTTIIGDDIRSHCYSPVIIQLEIVQSKMDQTFNIMSDR